MSRRIGPNLTAFLTVNTDFAETEVDTRQTNLTRFPLFFPEKRAFFVEGSDTFVFGLGLSNDIRPFFSRRIIMRVNGNTVKPGAILQGELIAELKAPLIAENFEGIAAFRNAAGATQLILVSDNNFNSIQRTLLLWFDMPQDQQPEPG